MFIQRSAKVIRYVIFSVGKSTGTAEAVHYRTDTTVNAVLDPDAVYRTAAFLKLLSGLEYSDL